MSTDNTVEEMATKLVVDMFGVEMGGSEFDVALEALTEAHQIRRDVFLKALDIDKNSQHGKLDGDLEITQYIPVSVVLQALDDTIKTLQDNK